MPVRIILVAGLVVALGGALYWSTLGHAPLKVSGFLESDEIRVGSRVGGRVKTVKAVEGQNVRTGDLLVELDPFDLKARRDEAAATFAERQAEYEKRKRGNRPEEIAQAEAKAEQLRASLAKAEHGPRAQEIAAAQAEVDLANAQFELANTKHHRAQSLFTKGAITQGEMDQYTSELSVARSTVKVKDENLKLLQAGTRPEDIDQARAQLNEALEAAKLSRSGYRREDVEQAKSAAEAAKALLDAAEKQLAELVISAPIEGNVESIDLRPGDMVSANAPAVSLIDASTLWVRAYVPENDLAVRIGQEVPVSVDSYPGEKFRGKIIFIARQAEFTPGNVQTPEERSKQVFRIKVNLLEGRDKLRPGMAADVWLNSSP